jgi:hypothetical protein
MRRPYVGDWQALPCQGAANAFDHPPRVGSIVNMLQLAPAAGAKMAASGRLKMRAVVKRILFIKPIPRRRHGHKTARRGATFSTRRQADDGISHGCKGKALGR